MGINIEEVKKAIRESSAKSKIYVGCDSKMLSNGHARYATVVVLHIDGSKGARLFSEVTTERIWQERKKPRMRLVMEAYKAVELANLIQDSVGDREFEIHLDLNTDPKYKSHSAVQEAVGYVMGCTGIKPKLKPYAFAASTAGDRIAG